MKAPAHCVYAAPMSVFVGHTSALEFWRSPASSSATACRAQPTLGSTPTRKTLEGIDFPNCGICSTPVHLTVKSAGNRGQSALVACHVCNHQLPSSAFRRVNKDICVSRPELCFLQLASMCSLVELTQIGFELCGTYWLAPNSEHGFRESNPVATSESLRHFVEVMGSSKGTRRARSAAEYVVDGSASPMETIVTMLLTLPKAQGGYGLPSPQLNKAVDMPKSMRASYGRSTYRPDLYWPKAKLAIEYDSTAFHSTETQLTNDSKRRAALAHAGLNVISLTSRQVYDAREFDKIALLAAKHLGIRMRSERKNLLTRRFELRSELLGHRHDAAQQGQN